MTTQGEAQTTGTAEVTAPPTLEELVQERTKLQSELVEAKKDAEKWQTEARTHQKNVTKKDQELQRISQSAQEIQDLKDKLDITAAMVADLVDREPTSDTGEEKPIRRKSEQYLTSLREKEQQRQKGAQDETTKRFLAIAGEAETLSKTAGLDLRKSPELREAYVKFLEGDPITGLEETKRILSSLTPKETKPVKTEAELKEEIRQQIYEEKGWNKSDTGKSVGSKKSSIPTKMEDFRKWVSELPSKEYKERKDEINEALQAGQIK